MEALLQVPGLVTGLVGVIGVGLGWWLKDWVDSRTLRRQLRKARHEAAVERANVAITSIGNVIGALSRARSGSDYRAMVDSRAVNELRWLAAIGDFDASHFTEVVRLLRRLQSMPEVVPGPANTEVHISEPSLGSRAVRDTTTAEADVEDIMRMLVAGRQQHERTRDGEPRRP